MDIQEFEAAFVGSEERIRVRCTTTKQRRIVVETLHKLFPDWNIQQELFDEQFKAEYLHPGMSYGLVVAYANTGESDISYDAFMEMVAAEDVSDDDVEAGFLDVIGNSFDDLVDRFAGCIVKSRSFPELDGKVVSRTIRKEESGVWIVKLEGVRAYQQLYEDEMYHPVTVIPVPFEPVKVEYEDIPF